VIWITVIPSATITKHLAVPVLPSYDQERYNSRSMYPFRFVAGCFGWDIFQAGARKDEAVLEDEHFRSDKPNEPELPEEKTW